jgi:prepilin-type N-terminal cleavage/methylation domain-containing protein
MALRIHESLPAGRQGFTLLEVIVSVAIALLLTGFIIVNYNTYNDTQKLKQAALTLKNDLRFAQGKALSGDKPLAGPSSCTQLLGYTLIFDENYYTMQPECSPEGLQTPLTRVNLTSGITFIPVPASFTFRVLSRGTSLPTPASLILSGNGNLYSIQVSPGGDISDMGMGIQ